MDAIALIEQARDAGLKLSAIDGRLVLKGPRRLSSLVSLIAENKDAVLAALSATAAALPPPCSQHSTTVGVTETPVNREESKGFADSVLANRKEGKVRQALVSPTPSSEVLADPVVLCPLCNSRRVLAELRRITGGLCYPCWEGRQG